MSSPNSPTSSGGLGPSWQEKLQNHCRAAQLHPPVFNIVSDRRGGRTAWSSTVTINQTNISARYWYDGQYVNNAKEDAAEVALQHLLTNSNSSSPISPVSPQSQSSMHQGSIWGSAGAGMPQQGAFFGGRDGRERAWPRGSVSTG
ncbi:MAG: hypothetical protein FRX48_01736 [Lasallia pustulata]|uniref:Double-stranded RNA-binding domain n=1 Tax=Lasallia pustulata TaxID=136370 RepID=A0A1W5DCE2_9LECA|nr:MAG: hypothetical protein FRX48_01736 [Lasallia pustulata]SLM40756.1 Double-stranded RNA-binding domain [Lasallia pustulata]